MGNRQSILEDIQIFKPPSDDLIFKDDGTNFKIFQHRYKNFQVMAHKITLNSQKQLPILIQNFKARYQHHYLVSTIYLAIQDYSTCGGYYQTVIFYQRLFTDLSKIKDIPFNDVLHFYAVAFKGFQLLYNRFGYFQIYEDMFHLGQDSKLKVWCSKDISRNQPQPYLIDKNGTQQDMLRKIIYIISQNTDHLTDSIGLNKRILNYGVRNFQMAHQSLRQICRQFNLSVPQRVQCMNCLPSQQVQMMLDLYTSQNGKIQNQLINTQDLRQSKSQPAYNKNLLHTPHFNGPTIPHTPITQQFTLPQNRATIIQNRGSFTQNRASLPQLNLSVIHKNNKDQSMIHTFNKRLQLPRPQNKRGIDLSLSQSAKKKPRKNSNSSHTSIMKNNANNHSFNVSIKPTNGHNNVIHLNNNPQNRPDYKSLQNKPDARHNSNSFNKNGPNLTVSPQYQNMNHIKAINKPLNQLQAYGNLNQQPISISNQVNNLFPLPMTAQKQMNKNITISNAPLFRQNNHVHNPPHNFNFAPINSQLVNHGPHIIYQSQQPKYYSQPHSSQKVNTNSIIINPIMTSSNLSTSILKNSNNQLLKRSNLDNKNNSVNHNNKLANNNHMNYVQPDQPRYIQQTSQFSTNHHQQFNHQVRQRRKSSKHNTILQNNSTSIINHKTRYNNFNLANNQLYKNQFQIKRDYSTPLLPTKSDNQIRLNKTRQNPFQLIQQSSSKNKKDNIVSNINQNIHLNVPFDKNYSNSQFNAHSTSSRYLYSNRQLNDNIPDVKYKKPSPKKNISRILDANKIIELQSFNQSKYGTQNSLKNEDSRVLEVIGRQKKNSITSAFQNQQKIMRKDSKYMYDNIYRQNNSNQYLYQGQNHKKQPYYQANQTQAFTTDPRILQILKRSSSKALQKQVNSLKKVTKSSKAFQFSKQSVKRPTLNKQINEDILKLDNHMQEEVASKKQQYNMKNNDLFQFQGFPSLSNLSDIKKIDQNSSNDDKANVTVSNYKNLTKKSRFSEDKSTTKKQQLFVSQFYNYQIRSPTFQHSYNDKRQIPNKDIDWKNIYATTLNTLKQDSISTKHNKTNDFKIVPEKPQHYLTSFNSNQSLASLQFQLVKKNQMFRKIKDRVKQSHDQNAFIHKVTPINVNNSIKTESNNRKYNPTIDPQINKDLERFRKQKHETYKP